MVTIRDVAKKAGVSIAAVSYALNNKKEISEEKRQHILKIAEEMGYVPNSHAKSLHTKKTNIVGLVVPDLTVTYTSTLMSHLEHFARQNNYYLLLGNAANDLGEQIDIIERFIAKNVDALILLPAAANETKTYQKLFAKIRKYRVPVICLSQIPGIQTNYIVPDVEEGQYLAASYLFGQGHRRFWFVGGYGSNVSVQLRLASIRKAAEEFGVPFDESQQVIECGFVYRDAYRAMKERLSRPDLELPTAIMAVNDSVAYAVCRGLKETGIRVPDDVSVVGFDDIPLPTMDDIPLTTIRIPLAEISRLCVECLERFREDRHLRFQYFIRPELIVRDTVAEAQ